MCSEVSAAVYHGDYLDLVVESFIEDSVALKDQFPDIVLIGIFRYRAADMGEGF